VIRVLLPRHVPAGHEQEGQRPAMVIATTDGLGTTRFPMLIIAPMTTQIEAWTRSNPLLYPIIPAGVAGLPQESAILLDQLRALSLSRLLGFMGTLESLQTAKIRAVTRRIFVTIDQTLGPNLRLYLENEIYMMLVRQKNNSADSEEEDSILDSMDLIWQQLTPNERDWLNARTKKIKSLKEPHHE
jgi:mRNA interferase MazF